MIDPHQVGGETDSPLWNELISTVEPYLQERKQGVIFVHNVFAREILAAALTAKGILFEEIKGEMPPTLREKARERFQNGEVPLVIVHSKVGGEGQDFTAADFIIEAQMAE